MNAGDSWPTKGLRSSEADVAEKKGLDPAELGAPIRSTDNGNPSLVEKQATHLRNSAASLFMFASMNTVLAGLDVASFRTYRDRLIEDYGSPTDPVVCMLLEQLALAHLNVGQLFSKASTTSSVECSSAYLAAAIRLMAEYRRTSLALPAYREAALRLERGPDLAESCQEITSSDSELHDRKDSDESTPARFPIGA
jgi:hypothetical protein